MRSSRTSRRNRSWRSIPNSARWSGRYEVPKPLDKSLRLFPRDAMGGIGTDPQFRVRQTLGSAAGGFDVLRIMLAGDPECGNGNFSKARVQYGRRPIAQGFRERAAIEVGLTAHQRIFPPAKDRLRIP